MLLKDLAAALKMTEIGDTWFDTKGARLCGVDFVGVEYGYGDLESMKKEGGRVFVKTTAELLDVLTK